ncbi:MAG: helix-turn-helix domain-containing protein [Spirochaetales bacterium]|nr:helix-turn-helix domain-containing protein [Spirochaetales bacterium]
MEQLFFSVNEIAKLLSLHPKTIQRFIREGKITARKIGREWKISQESFKEFAHSELKVKSENQDINTESVEPRKITVSAVIEITNQDSEEASRISNSLMALLNSKDPAWGKTRYDYIYYPDVRKAKFILYGTPKFISAIMGIFDLILTSDNNK